MPGQEIIITRHCPARNTVDWYRARRERNDAEYERWIRLLKARRTIMEELNAEKGERT